ncbi:MAG: hypothetical protein SPL82_14570 [Lachnospiraceae bacterium]|nr:hypothetical protein [Lachnospiraceae bacterium]
MGDEAVDGSKIGTKLIMFCAIIALVLVAFLVGKSLINSGVDNLETTSKTINDSRFSDYNKKVVKGRAVKSALENFNGEEVIILVHTLSEGSRPAAATTDNKNIVSASGVKSFLGLTTDVASTMQGVKIDGDNKWDSQEAAGNGQNFFVNYNALVKAKVSLKNGNYVYDDDFSTDASGNIIYNNNTENLTKKGSPEYISDGSTFKASLIKNSSGEIVGILFAQKKVG